jgi:hypothetical protein
LCSNQTSKINKEANNKWSIEESCPKLSQIPQNCAHTHTHTQKTQRKRRKAHLAQKRWCGFCSSNRGQGWTQHLCYWYPMFLFFFLFSNLFYVAKMVIIHKKI